MRGYFHLMGEANLSGKVDTHYRHKLYLTINFDHIALVVHHVLLRHHHLLDKIFRVQ